MGSDGVVDRKQWALVGDSLRRSCPKDMAGIVKRLVRYAQLCDEQARLLSLPLAAAPRNARGSRR